MKPSPKVTAAQTAVLDLIYGPPPKGEVARLAAVEVVMNFAVEAFKDGCRAAWTVQGYSEEEIEEAIAKVALRAHDA